MAQEILVNINVNSGTAEVKIDKLNKATKDLSKTFIVNTKAVASQKGEAKLASIEQKRLAYEMENAGKIASTYSIATNKATKGTKQFRTQVGLNNAILQEAGRAASDLRFGFNGVANNVGQLFSLFGSLINTSDNVATSLKNLGKSLLGTGGFLIAVQLLIAYADRIYAFFRGISESALAAEKALKKLEGTIQSQRVELLGYVEVLRTANIAEEVRYNALKELEEVVPELTKNNKDQKISLEELTLEVEDYIKQQRLRGELDALISNNADVFAERERIRTVQRKLDNAKSLGEARDIYNENATFLQQIGMLGEQALEALAKPITDESVAFNYADLYSKQTEDEIAEFDKNIARIIEIEKQLTSNREDKVGDGKTKKNIDKRFKVFREGLLNLEKLEESYRQKSIDKDLLTEEEKIEMQKDFALKELQISVDNFEAKEIVRLNAYVKQIQQRKLSSDKEQELIDKANLSFIKSIEKSEDDAAKVRVQINAATTQSLEDLSDKRRDNAIDNIAAIQNAERLLAIEVENLEEKKSFLDLDYMGRLEFSRMQIDAIIEETQAEEERLKALKATADFNISQTESKLGETGAELEEARESGADDEVIAGLEAKQALQLSNLSEYKLQSIKLEGDITKNQSSNTDARIKLAKAEANAKVQAFQVTADALNAFSKLAGEDTKIGKRLAVSGALISTYLSAQKAFESQFKPLSTVDSPIRGALAAAAAIASGMANVKAILKVDEKGTTSTSATPSAPPVNVQAPNFNVVGASATNQLAEAVSEKTQQPVKAYVSIKDVINTEGEFNRTVSKSVTG